MVLNVETVMMLMLAGTIILQSFKSEFGDLLRRTLFLGIVGLLAFVQYKSSLFFFALCGLGVLVIGSEFLNGHRKFAKSNLAIILIATVYFFGRFDYPVMRAAFLMFVQSVIAYYYAVQFTDKKIVTLFKKNFVDFVTLVIFVLLQSLELLSLDILTKKIICAIAATYFLFYIIAKLNVFSFRRDDNNCFIYLEGGFLLGFLALFVEYSMFFRLINDYFQEIIVPFSFAKNYIEVVLFAISVLLVLGWPFNHGAKIQVANLINFKFIVLILLSFKGGLEGILIADMIITVFILMYNQFKLRSIWELPPIAMLISSALCVKILLQGHFNEEPALRNLFITGVILVGLHFWNDQQLTGTANEKVPN